MRSLVRILLQVAVMIAALLLSEPASFSIQDAKVQYFSGRWELFTRKSLLAVTKGSCLISQDQELLITCFGNGSSEDQYLVGDWDGDGKDQLAVRRSNLILFQACERGRCPKQEYFGTPDDHEYVAGDWDGDGKDQLAVIRSSLAFFERCNGKLCPHEETLTFAGKPDQVLAGDWDGDGKDQLVVRAGNRFFFDHCDGKRCLQDTTFGGGNSEDEYLAGDWDGDGIDQLAVRRSNVIVFQGCDDRNCPSSVVFGPKD